MNRTFVLFAVIALDGFVVVGLIALIVRACK